MKFSEKCQQIQSSVTLAIDAKAKQLRAQGEDVVSFGAGEPDFATPRYITEAAVKALSEGKTKYTAAAGMPDLRKKIAETVSEKFGYECTFDQIVVCNGAKQALFNTLQVLCNPGDEVIVPAPYWVSYPELIKMAGATPVFVTMNADGSFDFDKLASAFSDKTKALILNTPSNPSGTVVPEEDVRKLARLAAEKDFMIISDEIYDSLVYDGAKHFSPTQIGPEAREHTVLINGMSKAYAMTGWRMGYSVATKELTKMMASFQSHATGNPNTIAQWATLAAISQKNDEFDTMYREFDERRRIMVEAVNAIPGLSAAMPKGAFYVMVDIHSVLGKMWQGKTIENSMDFASALLDATMTAVVPGGPFGAEGFIRLSYATDRETIRKGLSRIADFVKGVNHA